jgi:hypothetical protein
MLGQYWHPMFVPEVFPNVISLNTGAPFQPFIRNPLITYKYYFNNYNLGFTLISQRDNASDGPAGASPLYLRNSLMPNAHLQLQYKNENHVWGLAADYKVLQPRLETATRLKTNESIGSYAFMAYYKYVKDKFLWSAKTIYGQNLTEHLMMGGYAVQRYDSVSHRETYTPTNHINIWGLLAYGEKIRWSLFTGFSKNLGTDEVNTGVYYSRGHDIDYLYRVAPSVSFISGTVQLSTELEYTVAAYGTPNPSGLVKGSEPIGNLRLLFTFFYFF